MQENELFSRELAEGRIKKQTEQGEFIAEEKIPLQPEKKWSQADHDRLAEQVTAQAREDREIAKDLEKQIREGGVDWKEIAERESGGVMRQAREGRQKILDDLLEFGVGVTPVLGDLDSLYNAYKGESSITKERLSVTDRVVDGATGAASLATLGLGGTVLRGLKRLPKLGRGLKRIGEWFGDQRRVYRSVHKDFAGKPNFAGDSEWHIGSGAKKRALEAVQNHGNDPEEYVALKSKLGKLKRSGEVSEIKEWGGGAKKVELKHGQTIPESDFSVIRSNKDKGVIEHAKKWDDR